jgi:hypothetical protein
MTTSFGSQSRRAAVLLLGLASLSLAGCESAALTMFGIGASTGVQHGLNGVTYRTFTMPTPRVRTATLAALNRMAIKVEKVDRPLDWAGKPTGEEIITATANDRKIEVDLQVLTANTTRMRAVAKQGLFYDSATAYEIIAQTEKVLGG